MSLFFWFTSKLNLRRRNKTSSASQEHKYCCNWSCGQSNGSQWLWYLGHAYTFERPPLVYTPDTSRYMILHRLLRSIHLYSLHVWLCIWWPRKSSRSLWSRPPVASAPYQGPTRYGMIFFKGDVGPFHVYRSFCPVTRRGTPGIISLLVKKDETVPDGLMSVYIHNMKVQHRLDHVSSQQLTARTIYH